MKMESESRPRTTRPTRRLRLDLLLKDTREVIHILPFLLNRLLERVGVPSDVLDFVGIMLRRLGTRLRTDVKGNMITNENTMEERTHLLYIVPSPDIYDDMLRIRELSRDIKRVR